MPFSWHRIEALICEFVNFFFYLSFFSLAFVPCNSCMISVLVQFSSSWYHKIEAIACDLTWVIFTNVQVLCKIFV